MEFGDFRRDFGQNAVVQMMLDKQQGVFRRSLPVRMYSNATARQHAYREMAAGLREVAEYSRRGAPPLCAECSALVDALLAPPPPGAEPGGPEPPLRRLFEGTMSQLYERSHIAMLASADQRAAAPLNTEPWYGTRLNSTVRATTKAKVARVRGDGAGARVEIGRGKAKRRVRIGRTPAAARALLKAEGGMLVADVPAVDDFEKVALVSVLRRLGLVAVD